MFKGTSNRFTIERARPALAVYATEPSFPCGPAGSRRHREQMLPIRRSGTSYLAANRCSPEKLNMPRARFDCFRQRTHDYDIDKRDTFRQYPYERTLTL